MNAPLQGKQGLWALLLFLPFLVLGGIVLKNEAAKGSATVWRLPIQGYDPRDLLMGHYLNFRWQWPTGLGSCPSSGDCCLCLEGTPGTAPTRVSKGVCEPAGRSCASLARIDERDNALGLLNPEGSQKYFVPEGSARRLEQLLRDRQLKMEVELRVHVGGATSLGELYVQGLPWRTALKRLPGPKAVLTKEWQLPITNARFYGDTLVYVPDWKLNRAACPDQKDCSLCLKEVPGTRVPAITYGTSGQVDADPACQALHWSRLWRLAPDGTLASRGQFAEAPTSLLMQEKEALAITRILETRPEALSAEFSLTESPQDPFFYARELLVNGVPYQEWVQKNASGPPAGP